MIENDLSAIIVDCCYNIHVELGPGLLESVYEEVLHYELIKQGIKVSRQQLIPVSWQGIHLEQGFRADLIVEDSVIIEIKSVAMIAPVHKKQLLTYLRLTDLRLGLLVNFNEALIKDGLYRVVNKL